MFNAPPATQVTIANWWLVGLLNEWGWPRRTGWIRRRSVISVQVLERLVTEINKSAVVIGKELPEEAIGIVLDSFQNTDWTEQRIGALMSSLDPANFLNESDEEPWLALNSRRSGRNSLGIDLNETVDSSSLWADENHKTISRMFVSLVIWGFLHPEQVSDSVAGYKGMVAELVAEFQRAMRPLPSIPDVVRNDPTVSRRLFEIDGPNQ